ncbi:hypothetical protein HG530_010436 [Fusarium avenaceum]|nr:hypothetical protein HG530_010436 [Fusarium avenaceum]
MSQLNTKESSGIGGHGTSKSGTETWEEGLDTALAAGLDGVDGEDGDPHGDSGSCSGACNSCETELAAGLSSDRINRRHLALDVLVGGEIGSGTRSVTGEGSGAAAEDTADSTLLVQLADNVDAAVVLGLLARGKLLLALDLQDDLDALEGGGDGRHGNGGDETGG